jgi:hypothetical protein
LAILQIFSFKIKGICDRIFPFQKTMWHFGDISTKKKTGAGTTGDLENS